MKKTLKSIVLLGALCGGSLHATFQFRSPLSLDDRGYMHWLLAPSDRAWWYGNLPSEKMNTNWNTHLWGAAYTRSADRAFGDRCEPCSDKVTRHTETLSKLFFGEETFRGEEVFAGGTFATASLADQELVNGVNPFLEFARISPVFDYEETGALIGIDFNRYLGEDDRFHVGGRVFIPYKIIEIEQDTSTELEETLDDVFVTRIVNFNAGAQPDQVEYAMRFDFLSSLVFNSLVNTTTGTQTVAVPAVQYSNSPVQGQVTVTGFSISGTSSSTDSIAGYMTKSDSGIVPTPPFRRLPAQAGLALGPDGEGVNGQTYFLNMSVDYADHLRLDRNAQGTLFLVPRAQIPTSATPPNNQLLTTQAAQILTNVRAIIDGDLLISEPASTFFLNNGINLLAHERTVGVGDLFAEVYGGVGHYDDWFVDGIFGLRFPTGKRQRNSNDIFFQTLGNNGHLEINVGIDGGWKPYSWFAFEIRPYYYHACKRSERRAAPFRGATVINIGPEIDVNVSWDYFVLRTDFSFFHPHNPDLGFLLGYEFFAKGKDRVSFDCPPCDNPTATDLLGRPNQPLDLENFRRNTNSLTNKLRGQIFYRCNYFEIFGGGTQVVSGRNAMKETEGNLGLVIYF